MARVHRFDPRCIGGRGVNSSINADTSPASAQQSAQQLIHLSLQLVAAPRSSESAPEPVHSRERESRSSQNSPLIQGP